MRSGLRTSMQQLSSAQNRPRRHRQQMTAQDRGLAVRSCVPGGFNDRLQGVLLSLLVRVTGSAPGGEAAWHCGCHEC